jgi:hypothetical protein
MSITILGIPFMLRYRKNNNEKLFQTMQSLGMTHMQNYIPLYKRFFKLNQTNWNSINLDHPPLKLTLREESLWHQKNPVFLKYSPLLDPLKYLTGSYTDYDFSLPTLTQSHPKLAEMNNSSYVDAFFTFLSGELLQKGFIHGVKFYGSYLGIKQDFVYNVEDELEHLEDSDYFHQNRGLLFKLNREFSFSDSRKNKQSLVLSDEPIELVLDSLEDTESDYSDWSESGLNLHAIIHRFPVQVIAMEKYTDTLDSLLEEITPEELTSALMQVIMTLLAYQKAYQFTHNDLHTNNIMYVETDVPFLYYTYGNVRYKVPTYGKLFKIIDFGRSIYTYQHRRFVSDSFQQEGDAATQYNTEPFFDCSSPAIPPNYSFDLCRLACCILENDTDDGDIYDVVAEWCNDDKGDSVLVTPSGEERYPEFELYRMIARTVHAHTPEAQLKRPIFAAFETTEQVVGMVI